jgi:hypothetical protein
MKGNRFHLLNLISLLLVGTTACNASQVSGTYVAHSSTIAEMLQLTQTPDGQISGVFSYAELKSDGRVSSKQTPVSGTADAGQITLKFPGVLSFISGTSLAGTINRNAIHLQIVDSTGNVLSEAFERSSPSQFKTYADEMKSKGQGIVYNTQLLNLAQKYRETVANAERWIANAEQHAERISNAKASYERIESQMKLLVAKERATSNSVARSQISVAVTQGDIAGEQVDIQLQQIWDIGIGDSGTKLAKGFTGWDGNCSTSQVLHRLGPTTSAIEAWNEACKQLVAERARFEPIYRRLSEQRGELRSFQATAQAHRKALVNEANRFE